MNDQRIPTQHLILYWFSAICSAMLVSAFISFPVLIRLRFVMNPYPRWVEYAFLASPIGFIVTAVLLSRAHRFIRFTTAALMAVAGALVTPLCAREVTASFGLNRDLPSWDEYYLHERMHVRYITTRGELLVQKSDAARVEAYLKQRGLVTETETAR